MTIIEITSNALTRFESQAIRALIERLENQYFGREMVFVNEEAVNYAAGIDFSKIVRVTKAYNNCWKDSYFTDRFVKGGRHETAIRVCDLIKSLREVYDRIGTGKARKLARTGAIVEW